MRFSEELYARLDIGRTGIGAVAARMQTADRLPRMLGGWFGMLWHVIRATVPLLEHAAARLEAGPADGFARALAAYYRKHAEEERHHDRILLDDLGTLGITEQALLSRPPSVAITSMVGSQHYLIDYFHPAAFLGYVALLEGYPATAEQIESLIHMSGTSRRSWSCYRLHAAVDPRHREELAAVLDTIPEDRRLRSAIVTNGLRTAELYCEALEDLVPAARAA